MTTDAKELALGFLKEEIEGLDNLHECITEEFMHAIEHLTTIPGRIIVSGMGKSGHIGKKIAATLASVGSPAFFVHPTEALHGDLGMITDQDACILISNSGNTQEMCSLAEILTQQGTYTLSITTNESGKLRSLTNACACMNIPGEAGHLDLAPTTSTTATLIIGDVIALTLAKLKNFSKEDFARTHPGGTLGKRLRMTVDVLAESISEIQASQDTGVTQLIHQISAGRLGCAVITTSGKLDGIVTDGDIRRAIEKHERNVFDKTAQDIMTANPAHIEVGTLAIDALELMERKNITQLPIVEHGTVTGLLHMHALVKEGLK